MWIQRSAKINHCRRFCFAVVQFLQGLTPTTFGHWNKTPDFQERRLFTNHLLNVFMIMCKKSRLYGNESLNKVNVNFGKGSFLKENNFTDQFFCSAFLQQVLRHSKTVQYLDKILHKLSSKIWEIFPSNHSSKIVQKNLSKFSDKSTAWQGKQSQNGWENGFNL